MSEWYFRKRSPAPTEVWTASALLLAHMRSEQQQQVPRGHPGVWSYDLPVKWCDRIVTMTDRPRWMCYSLYGKWKITNRNLVCMYSKMWCDDMLWHHMSWHHMSWHHIAWYDITWHFMSCDVTWWHVISCNVMLCHIT